jgi:hypothetical protein
VGWALPALAALPFAMAGRGSAVQSPTSRLCYQEMHNGEITGRATRAANDALNGSDRRHARRPRGAATGWRWYAADTGHTNTAAGTSTSEAKRNPVTRAGRA